MGTELTEASETSVLGKSPNAGPPTLTGSGVPSRTDIAVVPWLDSETSALVHDIAATVAADHSDLRAIILIGSVARHDERLLDDPGPSDVDVLLLFDLEPEFDRLPFERRSAVFHSIGCAYRRHLDAPREVSAMPVVRDLADWDEMFVENVARDGLLLWARGPLPEPLAAVAARPFPHSPPR